MSGISLSALEEEVLILILGKKVYGLQIIDAITNLSEGERPAVQGTYYPILKRLEAKELIRSDWGESQIGARRRYYQITNVGIEAIRAKEAYRQRLVQWIAA